MPPKIIYPSQKEKSSIQLSLESFSGAQPGVREVLSASKLDALVLLDNCTEYTHGEKVHIAKVLNQTSWRNLWLTTLWDRLAVRARCLGLNPNNIGFIARSHVSSGHICEPSPFEYQYKMGMTDALVRDDRYVHGFRNATLGEIGFEGIEGLKLQVIRRVGDTIIPSHLQGMDFSTRTIGILRHQLAGLHKLGLSSDDIFPGARFLLHCARGKKFEAEVDEKEGLLVGPEGRRKYPLYFNVLERLDGYTNPDERPIFLEGDIDKGTRPQDSHPVILTNGIRISTPPILRMVRV